MSVCEIGLTVIRASRRYVSSRWALTVTITVLAFLTVFSALSVRDCLAGDLSLRGPTPLLKVLGDKSLFLAFFSVLINVRDCQKVCSSQSKKWAVAL